MPPGDEIDLTPAASTWRVPGYTAHEGIAVDRAGALVIATQDLTGRRVVLRVLTPALARDSGYMRRLRQRIPTLSGLRADHLVPVLGLIDQPPAVAEEAVEGPSLTRIIDRGGPLPPAAAFVVLDDCLEALAALHAGGLTHDDVRPGTVLVDRNGTVWLRDACVPVPPLHAGWNAGTPQYMAPELWAGRPHTVATDLYAAAAVFFEALSGRPPFPNADLVGLRRAHETLPLQDALIPASTRGLAAQGLAKDPASRPADAARFRADLATAAAAFLEDGWREAGRSWLAAAARSDLRQPAPPPAAPSTPEPDAAAVPEDMPPELEPAGWRETLWRNPRFLAGAALAALVLVIVIVVVASSLAGQSQTAATSPGGQASTPAPSSAGPLFTTSPGASVSPSSASASSSATPTQPATPVPTSTGAVSLGPASGSPAPTPFCAQLITPCPQSSR